MKPLWILRDCIYKSAQDFVIDLMLWTCLSGYQLLPLELELTDFDLLRSGGWEVPIAIPIVASMHEANIPKPITKRVRSLMATTQHQCPKRQNRWYPESNIEPLFLTACEPQINRQYKWEAGSGYIGGFCNCLLRHVNGPGWFKATIQ